MILDFMLKFLRDLVRQCFLMSFLNTEVFEAVVIVCHIQARKLRVSCTDLDMKSTYGSIYGVSMKKSTMFLASLFCQFPNIIGASPPGIVV